MASPSRITLDELIAINDEMAALARAGLPLEPNLRALSGDLPGRLGNLARLLSDRLERGQRLEQVLDEASGSFPPIYCAVVAAGLRTGRLAGALEGVSTTMRRVAEMRRTIIASMVYPLIVLLIASAFFTFTMLKTAPGMERAYSGLGVSRPEWFEYMLAITEFVYRALPWFWALFWVLVVVWLISSARAASLNRGVMGRFPSIGRILYAGRMATFLEVLTLMVEQRVPLDEAVILSATASGDLGIERAGKLLAKQIRSGKSAGELPQALPPLVSWLILSGTREEHLVKAMRQTAASYRRKALRWGNWLGVYLPIFLSAGIGGSVVLAYVIIVLAPFYHLLYNLAGPR